MSSVLSALARIHARHIEWTLALPRLGVPGCIRHGFDRWDDLPQPDIKEFSAQTKDTTILCVQRTDGECPKLVPLRSRVSGAAGRDLTLELVRLGVHPLDIVIATWSAETDTFVFRTSVDHLFWTHEDQNRLESEAISAD